jgi:hypothetical protein
MEARFALTLLPRSHSYDYTNSRYFPYAILDDDGTPLTQSDGGFDGVPKPTTYVDDEIFYEPTETGGGPQGNLAYEGLYGRGGTYNPNAPKEGSGGDRRLKNKKVVKKKP